jgi:hypothetical protein
VFLASLVAAVFIVRRVGVPIWWLLFPPLIEAIWSGSVNIIVLALALTRLEWLAVVTKTYAGLPTLLLGHLRQLLIAAAVVVASAIFLPWQAYFSHDLSEVLTSQAWGGRSAWINPLVLIPVSLAALLLIGRARAAWFSVPVLWPATQFHYSIFAIPAKPSALTAGILAIPWPGAPVAAVVAEAVVSRGPELLRRLRPSNVTAPGSPPQEGDSVPMQVVR